MSLEWRGLWVGMNPDGEGRAGWASFKLLSSLECSIRNKALGLGWERGKGCLSHNNNEEEEEWE